MQLNHIKSAHNKYICCVINIVAAIEVTSALVLGQNEDNE
jgi:hypothetical protein